MYVPICIYIYIYTHVYTYRPEGHRPGAVQGPEGSPTECMGTPDPSPN